MKKRSDNPIAWIQDEMNPKARQWEEFYRNRWQHDKVIRSTHGVNCTGSCSWDIHVKNGIVTWEMQGLDYPSIDSGLPPYEPRGCQRGISFSWYLYSPLRVKYPYARGYLLDLWAEAKRQFDDPVQAWQSIVNDPDKRRKYQQARGKGGFRRVDWDTAVEMIAASAVHTIKTHGPDRITGFSPIPAMSQISFAGGSRLVQLLGGVHLSFYDWYCDLPPASPEVWGEQTDVNESADWFNAKLLAVMGSNLNMTRTPDCHFAAEARHNGTKMWVFSPDFSQVSKYADEWVAVNAGQDGAWWMAVNHVLLTECFHENRVERFEQYVRQYTDLPFLVEVHPATGERAAHAGQLLRAGRLSQFAGEENGDWKMLMWDRGENKPKMPQGTVGHRWGQTQGKWNLKLEDGVDGSPIDPALTFLEDHDESVLIELDDFSQGTTVQRAVPARRLTLADGQTVLVTTVMDVMMAQHGVSRGLAGDTPISYDDEAAPYTPAWAEKYTGMGRETVTRFAREWARTAELTGGQCTVIIGAGINHWYHANLMYRAAMNALMLCGCVGVNGGGLAHYVGQEKLAPMESWSSIAFARDWYPAARLQNGPSWHYVHSDQWRYERHFTDYHTVPGNQPEGSLATGHVMDVQTRAVSSGWLPFFPQFHDNPIQVVEAARAAGCETEEQIRDYIVERLKSGEMKFAVEDPDAEENWPRLWFIWRGNAIMTSAKGQEYFLKHYLGTHNNIIAEEIAEEFVKTVKWHSEAPQGKMDLIVDLNFRMDTSALYSDIVLPAATWYEKADLNSTDMHSFIQPLSEAVPPCWESKSDWQIFQYIAKAFSEVAKRHFPEPVEDVVMSPLAHDTPAEIAQPDLSDWRTGECEAIPGKTMPNFKVLTRDYKDIYRQYITFGPLPAQTGLGAHGTHYTIEGEYEQALEDLTTETWDGVKYLSLREDQDVCDVILRLATVSNGELAYRSYAAMEKRVGLPLTWLAEKNRSVKTAYAMLQKHPERVINSPMWSGLTNHGRAYAPFTYNVEALVPWRTLTGRQHFYLDHPLYIQYGEHVPTHKPKPLPTQYADLRFTTAEGPSVTLNYLTPHGKWHIHSTYGDTERMLTLSRGGEPLWISPQDAEAIGIVDNDWVEMYNDHGVVVTRAAVSARIPSGVCIHYHAVERTYNLPKSPLRGNRRAGATNSLVRTRLKPNLMAGGYAQFTFHMNYWGPVGCNRDVHIMVRKLPKLRW